MQRSLNVQCDFKYVDGDIDLELYQFVTTPEEELDDPTTDERKPVLLTRATTQDDDELINYTVSAGGIYFIRVYYGDAGNVYNLLWDDGFVDAAGDSAYIEDYQYGGWTYLARERLASALLASPDSNTDGDTMPNWAEYALGLDASQPDYAVVGQSITEIEGEEYFQFEYLRTKEAVARGFQFIVEESGNMVFDGLTAVFVGTEDVDSDIERVFYRCSGPMDEVSQCFFRLKVLEPVAKD